MVLSTSNWLRFTGREGVKAFLRMSFESSNLRNERVAEAAGFSIVARIAINSVETGLQVTSLVNEQFAKAASVRTLTKD